MENMREVMKRNLARSLETLPPIDRLDAAWRVACGRTMAERGSIVGFEQNVVCIAVENSAWLEQMRSMGAVLQAELARIAGVKIAAIHFVLKGRDLSRAAGFPEKSAREKTP